MRIFALSDLHVDYEANARWVRDLSRHDYQDDVLILAGDITHRLPLLQLTLSTLASCFEQVLFVPGNHDLWVFGEAGARTSLEKFEEVQALAESCGVSTRTFNKHGWSIVPLLSWYDYSFGPPSDDLKQMWADYRACRWPTGMGPAEATAHFLGLNRIEVPEGTAKIISFSHFLPRLDLVPFYVPAKHRMLDPVLGSDLLERQVRRIHPSIHVYGHSHINRSVRIDGIKYVNNAFGYPQEEMIASKKLLCIDET
ncbi:MAG: metallophosphoesterase [Lysobacteraceae bacterium]|nr:MAG: metallophosphoesterase [Xanthomonadaceae bacterium]